MLEYSTQLLVHHRCQKTQALLDQMTAPVMAQVMDLEVMTLDQEVTLDQEMMALDQEVTLDQEMALDQVDQVVPQVQDEHYKSAFEAEHAL